MELLCVSKVPTTKEIVIQVHQREGDATSLVFGGRCIFFFRVTGSTLPPEFGDSVKNEGFPRRGPMLLELTILGRYARQLEQILPLMLLIDHLSKLHLQEENKIPLSPRVQAWLHFSYLVVQEHNVLHERLNESI